MELARLLYAILCFGLAVGVILLLDDKVFNFLEIFLKIFIVYYPLLSALTWCYVMNHFVIQLVSCVLVYCSYCDFLFLFTAIVLSCKYFNS